MKKYIALLTTSMALFAGEGGDIFRSQVMFENLEIQKGGTVAWDMNAYAGYNINKLYLFSEGEGSSWQTGLVYSRAISPFWDLQIGAQTEHDQKNITFGQIGLYGVAPYWIETQAKLLFGHGGVGVDLNFAYETLFTQKLVLDTSIATRWMSKAYPEIGVGKGLNFVEFGAQLRYEIKREFAPYIGVKVKRNFGETKRIQGEKTETSLVAGVRFWF